MKSKIIGSSFLLLSIIFLIFWFDINNKGNQLNKKIISLKEQNIILKETNDVLLLEYAAYSNPKYIKKISLVYLENKEEDLNMITILEEKSFIDKIEKIKLIFPTSINTNYQYNLNKGIN